MSKIKVARGFRRVALDAMVDLHQLALSTVSKEQSLVSLFEVRVTRLETIRTEFESHHNDILTSLMTSDGSIDDEVAIQASFDNCYFQTQLIYNDLFPKVAPSVASVTTSNSVQSRSNVRLPKIDLPKFDGSYRNWPSFIELFTCLIHENESLSEIEKFQYLQSSVVGDPLNIIRSYALSASNYSLAYAALLNKYDSKRKLLAYYWEDILKLNSEGRLSLRQILDTYKENLSMIERLNYKIDPLADFIISHSLLNNLGESVRFRFERSVEANTVPTLDSLMDFLELECRSLELSRTDVTGSNLKKSGLQSKQVALMSNVHQSTMFCIVCNKSDHKIHTCSVFKSKSFNDKRSFIIEKQLCFNCFGKHRCRQCESKSRCNLCHGKHHSLLHDNSILKTNSNSNVHKSDDGKRSSDHYQSTNAMIAIKGDSYGSSPCSGSSNIVTMQSSIDSYSILLSTVLLEIKDSSGKFHSVRAVLDTGSQANFISTRCSRFLGLGRKGAPVTLHGIGNTTHSCEDGRTSCTIRSRIDSSFEVDLEVIALAKICNTKIPTSKVLESSWTQFKQLPLADPGFSHPDEIDLLLGAELFPLILIPEKVQGTPGSLAAINTRFGWVLMGKCNNSTTSNAISNDDQVQSLLTVSDDTALDKVIKAFWEVEEIPTGVKVSEEDEQCERIFAETHRRDAEGRYEVHMPFKIVKPVFHNTFPLAYKRLMYLEKRLKADPVLQKAYGEFMRDYLTSGHMHKAVVSKSSSKEVYYIPHHAIYNAGALRPKLRVVFDASAKDSSGNSLNSTLLAGPKLQLDIAALLIQFRSHRFVFCTDVRQMYRQILIHPDDRDFQRILWRFSTEDPVEEYVLNTVTYGVASAPFLALRMMIQLAKDEEKSFPLAARVLQTSVYVDDILTGASTVEEALKVQQELIAIFASAGMELRKWSANHPRLLAEFPPEHCEMSLSLDKEVDDVVKVLGLRWVPRSDTYSFVVKELNHECTKRTILSELARIFDPLGFLAPIAFFAKHYMQLLWSLGLGWDERPPKELLDKWLKFKGEMPLISKVKIARYVPTACVMKQLHGFCDASERGYAAVVYLRVVMEKAISIHFIASKSRVAPLKRISLPRLELAAAHLLAKVMSFVRDKIEVNDGYKCQYFAWSDSTITLAWIKSSPHKWKTFVSNRVSEIQDKVPPNVWHHVAGIENPADCASRGLMPSQLVDHELWWTGPRWLILPERLWPAEQIDGAVQGDMEERKVALSSTVEVNENAILKLFESWSSFSFIQRVVTYVLRFASNAKIKEGCLENRVKGVISAMELNQATTVIAKVVQWYVFRREIGMLKEGTRLPKSLKKLDPFLDDDGVLRVGGRLRHSQLLYGEKFPILLPKHHKFTHLLIHYTHVKFCHIGVSTLQYVLSQQFWILSARQTIRTVLAQCMVCFRCRPVPAQPFMGDLPKFRVTPQVKPFIHTGVDFGGPFLVKVSKLRNAKAVKTYVCIFVCMAVKAVHLELVSDLTACAFLAALRRFVARRGKCVRLFSDFGTNFVGAHRKLLIYVKDAAAIEAIEWSFNPPAAPHFGGIWEAGIKSVKTHLRRVIGLQVLTYEELYTVLVQIEAVLNSRPLVPQSTDPSDLSVLTPGHFLTLAPMVAVPEPIVEHISSNHLQRWRLLQGLHQCFWSRWKREYLHTLQQRHKWFDKIRGIQLGSLVLIAENTPPLHWKRGRVIKMHPGKDGVCRVVTLKTSTGVVERPLVKVCPLPMS